MMVNSHINTIVCIFGIFNSIRIRVHFSELELFGCKEMFVELIPIIEEFFIQ